MAITYRPYYSTEETNFVVVCIGGEEKIICDEKNLDSVIESLRK